MRSPLPLPRALARLLPCALLVVSACGSCGEDPPPDDPSDMRMMPDPEPDMKDPEPEEDMEMPEPDMKMPEPDMKDPPPEEDMKMATPDMGIPDGPAVRPLTFSVYPPIPSSCDAPGVRYRLPFAVLAEESESEVRRPLRPYDRISGRPLIPGRTVTVGAVTSERTRIAPENSSCQTTADCTEGFKCASGGLRGATKSCVRNTGVALLPDTVSFDYDPGVEGRQLVTVLVENSGGLQGYLPFEVGALYGPGEDGMLTKDLFKQDARATDPDLSSRTIVSGFLTFFASYVDPATTRLSVWWFAGDSGAEVVPLTKTGAPEDHFVADLTGPIESVEDMPEPSAQRGTGNVNQAIMRVIERDLGLDKYAGEEKFLFLFTDGPNEVFDDEATDEQVLRALVQNEIHLFVVHFDPSVDPEMLRDPLAYWAGSASCRDDDDCQGAPTCTDDSDCANFEVCRKATLYPAEDDGQLQETALSQCLPAYRDDGRLGPSNVYADIACRTQGNYLYFSDVRSMQQPLRELPAVVDGQWSVEAEISYLNLDRTEQGFYRLSGVFLGLFGNAALGTTLTSEVFGPDPNDPMQQRLLRRDNRPVLRLGTP